MVPSNRLREKWIRNFRKSPIFNYEQNKINRSLARQLFYGTQNERSSFPSNFEALYQSNSTLSQTDTILATLSFLEVTGITLSRDIAINHIKAYPNDLNNLLKHAFFILKTFAHKDSIDPNDPFAENDAAIEFLVRIETGQAQLTIFDIELPQLYARNTAIPNGYDSNPIIKEFFSRIEGSNQSFFITGKAGTGKSTFIHYFTQKTKKTVVLMALPVSTQTTTARRRRHQDILPKRKPVQDHPGTRHNHHRRSLHAPRRPS
jgi:hypothetical protein